MNTFTGKQWGDGNEDPALFNPTSLDVNQWLSTCREAGIRQVILTCKHHDGFCLWPSKYTEHSVANSPWKNGKGDLVRELADACREMELGFGVYLSPWDRNSPVYGDSPRYNAYFLNQLRELLTQYGKIDEVWFDGACGEGPNGRRQVYDWEAYYSLIRELQPEAVIAIMGPDVRWVGTETGYGRETEWSVVPLEAQNRESIAEGSQKDVDFVPANDFRKEDLGSRSLIKQAKALVWYPAETDVSIRPGWFYDPAQDTMVKSPEKLLDIYFHSVGANSVLLLNLPPDKRGLIHENDVEALRGLKALLDQLFAENFAGKARLRSDGRNEQALLDSNNASYWTTRKERETGMIEITLPGARTSDVLALQENIRIGQRIEKFRLEYLDEGEWKLAAEGTTVGYKRLLRFEPVTARDFRLVIEASRLNPTLSELGLYKLP
jgi:alpha-L-fucosidase